MTSGRHAPDNLTGEARKLIKVVIAAGGEIIRYTSKGHMLVQGPTGQAFVSLPHGKTAAEYRSMRNNIAQLRRYAGLNIEGVT